MKNNVMDSLYDRCLYALLTHLDWGGDDSRLFESMPHLMSIQDIEKFSWVMNNIGYTVSKHKIEEKLIDKKSLPCLFVPDNSQEPIVILNKENNNNILIYDPITDREIVVDSSDMKGRILTFKHQSEDIVNTQPSYWFKEVIYDCKGMIFFLAFTSLMQALLFITPSAYIMFLYDKVINAGSYKMLISFFIGMVFALSLLVFFMNIRSRVLGYFGSKLQSRIGSLIFIRLLKLQSPYIEKLPLSRHMIRISDFNQLREFFGSPLFSTLLDLPFVTVFLLFIWFVAGSLVLVPIIAIIFYFIVAQAIWFFSRRIISDNGMVRGKYTNLILETLGGMRSLQFSGIQDIWSHKFNELSALHSRYGKNMLLVNSFSESIFDALTLFTGMATLITGAVLIINESMEVGALIATLFVIWRLLAPVKTIAVMYGKLLQIGKSAKQIDELMMMPTEIPERYQIEATPKEIMGSIKFEQVSFRYPNADDITLKNVSFAINPGETILIIGPIGSGKTTIAKLLLNLYPAQGGHIFIDDINVRQFDVNFLRKQIAFAPQKPELFYGTIEQNLLLAKPTATHEEIREAAKAANLLEPVEKLYNGFNTRIRFYGDDRIGVGFCQKISLARAYLRDAPILMLDEPTSSLDSDNSNYLVNYLKTIKGKKTIIMFAHTLKCASVADRVMVLFDGYVVATGTPDEIAEKLPKEFQ